MNSNELITNSISLGGTLLPPLDHSLGDGFSNAFVKNYTFLLSIISLFSVSTYKKPQEIVE